MTVEELKNSLPGFTDPKLLEKLIEKGQIMQLEPGKVLM